MMSFKLSRIIFTVIALACCGCATRYVDQEKRILLFQSCMASAQSVAPTANDNEAADVVRECDHVSSMQATTSVKCQKCEVIP